jgi:hypothetical protein
MTGYIFSSCPYWFALCSVFSAPSAMISGFTAERWNQKKQETGNGRQSSEGEMVPTFFVIPAKAGIHWIYPGMRQKEYG